MSHVARRWLHALAVAFTLYGCGEGTPVGRPCEIGTNGGSSIIQMRDQALECEGRLCLQMGLAPARCSAVCSTDDDCAGERVGSTPCTTNFVCAVATDVGPHACQRVCICRDDAPGFLLATPVTCQ